MQQLQATLSMLLLVSGLSALADRAEPTMLPVEDLAPDLHRLLAGEAGCVLVYDTPEGRVVVDTADAAAQPALVATLRQLGEKPVRWVINTHYHDDHIAGNAALRAIGAVLVGHANLAREARKALTVKEWDWHRKPADEASLPQVEIHGRTDFVLGGHRIEITVAPRAHTDTDLMIWFPDANTVHMGDILEVGGPLFIDQWAGGSLEGVLAAIDSVLARADAETRIIPGHGKVVRKPELEAYRHMLVDVSTKVDAAIAAGLSAQEIVDAGLAAPYEEAVGGPVAGKRLVYTIYLDRTLEPKS